MSCVLRAPAACSWPTTSSATRPRRARTWCSNRIYWAGWVTALALAMWLVFHFVITRRTARLVDAAEQIAAGKLGARSGLKGTDELGRLSRSFDAMALEVAETQTRLRQDIDERARVQRELENSETRLQQILNNATAVVCVKDTEGRFLFVNRQWEHLFHFKQGDVVGTNRARVPRTRTSRGRFAPTTSSCSRATRRWSSRRPRALDDGVHTYISIKFPLHDAAGVAYARLHHLHRHHRAQARRRSAAHLGGQLPGDLRRRRGRDLRARHRHRRDRGRQSAGLFPVRLHARGVPRRRHRRAGVRREPRNARTTRWRCSRAWWRASRSASNGTAGARTERCAGTRSSASASRSAATSASSRWRATSPTARAPKRRCCASEEQYRSMFNASIDGLALWDERRRDRRHQPGAVADVRLRRGRVRGDADRPVGGPS